MLGVLVAALTLGSPGASTPAANIATSQAFAIRVTVPGVDGQTTGYVSAPKDSVAFGGGYAYPADGSLVTTGSVTSSAGADPAQTATATASAEVSNISIFGGEIAIGTASAKVRSSAGPAGSTGDFSGTGISGIGGSAVAANTASEWASFSVGGTSGGPANTDEAKGWRGSGTGFVVRLTADHNGYPAGTTIEFAYVEVNVSASVVETPAVPTPAAPATPAAPESPGKNAAPKVKTPKPPEPGAFPRRTGVPNVDVKLTPRGYVFPVYGPASYTNTFGAGRADVGWHHGEDIFAPLGAPVLAVADGMVFSVGWNRVGGWRLWLVDRQGNQFYYAHLSAYAPAAFNGNRVKAGAVLGFVGNTGDAQGTPYHLHFEIHPVGLLSIGYDGVIAPFPWLEAVRRLQDVRFSNSGAWLPGRSNRGRIFAPQPGAILLQMSDISTASGLDPSSLQRALAPLAHEGDGLLVGGFLPPTSAPPVLDRG